MTTVERNFNFTFEASVTNMTEVWETKYNNLRREVKLIMQTVTSVGSTTEMCLRKKEFNRSMKKMKKQIGSLASQEELKQLKTKFSTQVDGHLRQTKNVISDLRKKIATKEEVTNILLEVRKGLKTGL